MVEKGKDTSLPKLKVLNSFTGEKEEFVPEDPNEITWYTCGPTVYDHSHMGHARTYVSFDIMRRVMTDFFGFPIKLVMNITDIDDKIIIKSQNTGVPHEEISRHFETLFLADLKALNVALPDVITRVTEYVPEVVAFIAKIIDNGYAYESNGSVYFAVDKFDNDKDHTYAKLEPGNKNNQELLEEGEGALTEGNPDKRNNSDFALWKKVKEGEPSWDSPWGKGRPGWHIECSAMCSAIFQKYPIDIHTGGCDLKFPHHDNEIAQSEAYYNSDTWINNFWHTGHLHIDGKKMSKSLKNFTTIKEILEHYNARQIRYMFLIHQWNKLMTYDSEKSLAEAVAKDRQFTEFFRSVKSFTRNLELKAIS
jgi:cysteinyl-tRNA synthetase